MLLDMSFLGGNEFYTAVSGLTTQNVTEKFS
jgi:hypothetical protein